MTRMLALEDFGSDLPEPDGLLRASGAVATEAAGFEAETLQAYENGYKNGWSDCAAAEAEERRNVAADLARNLGEARLAREGARSDVLAALGPFFEDIVGILLPQMTAAAVTPMILAELGALAERHTEAQLEILAAPETCIRLERLIEMQGIEVSLRPEPAFAEGQVSIRAADERRDIDMTGAVRRITEAIAGLGQQVGRTTVADPVQTRGVS